ncbi:hypothetical protein ABW19_dt0205048 [Dactylella cylindrospora]|nr:hypothetical protein ABW19_dt0205048 [Dactylella cylindrospora]
MAVDTTPPRKEGDTRWAKEYLLDPLNAVEAYQMAQTGGQYNDSIPTQHKTVTIEEYRAAHAAGENGLGRSRSLRLRGGQKEKEKEKEKENGESQETGVRRSGSIREKFIRRFTDDKGSSQRNQRPLKPLNEVSDKEISLMGNTVPPKATRVSTPVPEKAPDVQSNQDNNDIQNQENKPIAKKVEDRYSNNPYRDVMLDAENKTPPGSPNQGLQRTGTNPFRRGEGSSPLRNSPPSRPQSRTPQPHRNMPRGEGPRPQYRPRPRGPQVQRTPAADTIDHLDTSFGLFTFHHEGPYDATLSHRNRLPHKSPVEATRYGNEMALQATAPEDIENSLQFGRPLEGVAAFPPGTKTSQGGVLEYEEYDVNRQDGNFRRYPGLRYRDEDLKGKGIEGYDGDLKAKREKEAKHRRGKSLDVSTYTSKPGDTTTTAAEQNTSLRRNGSTAGRLEGAAAKIKRTFSLKRKERRPGDA